MPKRHFLEKRYKTMCCNVGLFFEAWRDLLMGNILPSTIQTCK